jgi:hypothetical protein
LTGEKGDASGRPSPDHSTRSALLEVAFGVTTLLRLGRRLVGALNELAVGVATWRGNGRRSGKRKNGSSSNQADHAKSSSLSAGCCSSVCEIASLEFLEGAPRRTLSFAARWMM